MLIMYFRRLRYAWYQLSEKPQQELNRKRGPEKVNWKTSNFFTVYGGLVLRLSIHSLHITSRQGGRGFITVVVCVNNCKIALNCILSIVTKNLSNLHLQGSILKIKITIKIKIGQITMNGWIEGGDASYCQLRTIIMKVNESVCSYHVRYAFQSKLTLYICLNVK